MDEKEHLTKLIKSLGFDTEAEETLLSYIESEGVTDEVLKDIIGFLEVKAKEAQLEAEIEEKRVDLYDNLLVKLEEASAKHLETSTEAIEKLADELETLAGSGQAETPVQPSASATPTAE